MAWEFLTLLRVRLGGKLLSIVALAIGGTGLSPLLHVIKSAPSADFLSYGSAVDALIFNSRFLGYFDSSLASGTWQSAFGEVPHSVRLPIKTFGYQLLRTLTDAAPGIVLEKIYDEFPRDTGIYGSFAQKPVGLSYALEVWKKDLPELPGLVAKIESFFAGTLLNAARFLTDHDVRYVVWSVRESKDIDAWKSIMQAIDADYRWMEFSTAPEAPIGLTAALRRRRR